MEYYDELNIAVTVRRGTIAALYNIMSKQSSTSSSSTSSNNLGHIVFYFINSQNMSQVRERLPWTTPTQSNSPSVVVGAGSSLTVCAYDMWYVF